MPSMRPVPSAHWNLTGEFIFKDVVLLCVCAVLFLASLPRSVVPLRTA